MYMVFLILTAIIVNNSFYTGYVKPPASHIGSNEYISPSLFESGKNLCTLVLWFISMDTLDTPWTVDNLEILYKGIYCVDLVGEDEHLVPWGSEEVIEVLDKPLELVEFFSEDEDWLAYVFIGEVFFADDYLDRVC